MSSPSTTPPVPIHPEAQTNTYSNNSLTPPQGWRRLWLRWIEPAVAAPNIEPELHRLLMQLLVLIFILALGSGILYIVLVAVGILSPVVLGMTFFGLAIILVSYGLSYMGRYIMSALVITATVIVLPLLVIILDTSPQRTLGNITPLFSSTIVLANVLLPRRYVFRLALATFVAIALLVVLGIISIMMGFFSTVTLIAFLVLSITYDQQRTLIEQDRNAELILANQALKDSEAQLETLNLGLEQIITDRTAKLVIAKEAAEQASQVKSAFLSSMSHELRTPLNAIINFSRFVAKGAQGPVNERQLTTLNEVVSSSRHLLNLINDVLDMSKIESGSLNLFVEDGVQLQPILESALETTKSLLENKPIVLSSELQPNLPAILGDRQRILQVLLNILSNACKFTDQGNIELRAYRDNNQVIFSIKDTGQGIAPEDQPAVFEAFKQTESGLRQGGGTGLGMPITKSLVEAHGGQIWLESVLGVGTTFYVRLPIQSEQLTSLAIYS